LLEKPCIFDKAHDELYELDDAACNFVQSLPLPADGKEITHADREFLDYCVEEGIFSYVEEPTPRRKAAPSPVPSLRYLLLHITTRCNLKCSHCFLGETEPRDMPLEHILRVMDEFDSMQGLRLLISGGEPLLHPQFWELNSKLDRFSFRSVILSNGTTLTDPRTIEKLKAHEVQISLDGIGYSHDVLRGHGSFRQSLKALHNLSESDIDISIATMVHAKNTRDFDKLEEIVKTVGAREWNIDVPAYAGRWNPGDSPAAEPAVAAPLLTRAFGGGVHHTSSGEWACGAHLGAVMADGSICKCGFYADSPAGTVTDGLAQAWQDMPRIRLSELSCNCKIVAECRGGCRYRAEVTGDIFGRDPIMCAAHGVSC
jgi:radical SAM protein with 4Fe4S-binding SPASM domain